MERNETDRIEGDLTKPRNLIEYQKVRQNQLGHFDFLETDHNEEGVDY